VDGEQLLCEPNDAVLEEIVDGTPVWVDIPEGGGSHLAKEFPARLFRIPATEADEGALFELLEHVSLGRDPAEVSAHFEQWRQHYDVVVLRPQ
jgi:hypothetical protein